MKNKNIETKIKKDKQKDEIAWYRLMRACYAKRFSLRFKLFRKILEHMCNSIGKRSTVYLLMDEMRKL